MSSHRTRGPTGSADATAFKYLSAAAERSYIPAMIETAKLLHNGRGVVEGNPKRAIELLEVAALLESAAPTCEC